MADPTIPGADVAFIPAGKVRGYLLNPNHPDGAHKLRVFRAALGVGPDDWEEFETLLLDGLQRGTVTETRDREDCTLYGVTFSTPGIDGTAKRVQTSWKVPKQGGSAPSFVTGYLDTRAE